MTQQYDHHCRYGVVVPMQKSATLDGQVTWNDTTKIRSNRRPKQDNYKSSREIVASRRCCARRTSSTVSKRRSDLSTTLLLMPGRSRRHEGAHLLACCRRRTKTGSQTAFVGREGGAARDGSHSDAGYLVTCVVQLGCGRHRGRAEAGRLGEDDGLEGVDLVADRGAGLDIVVVARGLAAHPRGKSVDGDTGD